jgi:hypothetical protein
MAARSVGGGIWPKSLIPASPGRCLSQPDQYLLIGSSLTTQDPGAEPDALVPETLVF